MTAHCSEHDSGLGSRLYSGHDTARLLPEPAKRAMLPGAHGERRSPFSRDRARVLHSAALRRLAGKTQVVGPGEGAELRGAPRTRLTHSLEVAQIGRGLAEELGCDPDLVDAAGLAHDIGHPPFGHNGERALDEVAGPCGGFEGNAQTLRILTRLEPKVLDDERCHGLNLTRACLDATAKYPWPRADSSAGSQPKFGVYADDLDVFGWIRDGAPPRRRCLEAQIMEWADDVAYSVHDVEDGILAGRIRLAALADPIERAALAQLAAQRFCGQPVELIEHAAARLLDQPVVAAVACPAGFDGSLTAQVALKTMTSELVGRFAAAAVDATRAAHDGASLRRYGADLAVPAQVVAEVALLKAVALRYVMHDPLRLELQAEQRALLTELVEALCRRVPEALDPVFAAQWDAAADDAARLRAVIDQVAALTDSQAVAWHRALTSS